MAYQAVEEIQNRCEKEGIPFWKAVQLEDCEENGITEEESWQLYHTYIFLLALLINLFCFFPCQPRYEIR